MSIENVSLTNLKTLQSLIACPPFFNLLRTIASAMVPENEFPTLHRLYVDKCRWIDIHYEWTVVFNVSFAWLLFFVVFVSLMNLSRFPPLKKRAHKSDYTLKTRTIITTKPLQTRLLYFLINPLVQIIFMIFWNNSILSLHCGKRTVKNFSVFYWIKCTMNCSKV
jgi:hypothetical protein